MIPNSFNPMGLSVVTGYFLVEYQFHKVGTGEVVQDWTRYDPSMGFVYRNDSYVGDIRFTPRPGFDFTDAILNVWTLYHYPPWEIPGSTPYAYARIGNPTKFPVKYSDYLNMEWINDVPGSQESDWSSQWVNISFDTAGEAGQQGEYIAFLRSSTYRPLETYIKLKNKETGDETEWEQVSLFGDEYVPDDPDVFISGIQVHNAPLNARFVAWPPERGPDAPFLWDSTVSTEGEFLEISEHLLVSYMDEQLQELWLFADVPPGSYESDMQAYIFIYQ